MFLLDDILLAPTRGLLFCFREIRKAVEGELHDTKSVVCDLQELYMLLETGKITEREFQEKETILLDRLDAAERAGHP